VASNSRAKAMNFSIEYAVKVATKKGYREILIEAGPSLLAEALHLKLVDELFLTIVQLPAPSGENNIDINLFTQGYVETQRSESQNSAVQESYLTFQPAQLSQAK
jgi:riboflavin biosynthesis pyrimidine reductase